MVNFKNADTHRRITAAFAVGLAVLLHMQFKFFQSEAYVGLRINLADIALPFLGMFILTSLFTKRSKWPRWRKPFLSLIHI